MKLLYLIPFLSVLLYACNHKKQPVSTRDSSLNAKPKHITPAAYKQPEDSTTVADTIPDTTQKLLRYSCRHVFSDPAEKDSLVLTLYGKHIENANFVFEIWNSRGKKLFRQVFNSYDMLIDLSDEPVARKQDSVKSYAARFFDQSNFHTPAIDTSEKFDDDYSNPIESDRKDWKQVKADKSAVGFTYNYGYEGTTAIAWSKSAKKVVEIFYSD